MLKLYLLCLLIVSINACNQRQMSNGLVCVCDENNCDTIVPGLDDLTNDNVKVYYTSKTEPGFNVLTTNFINTETNWATKVTVDAATKYQKIIGFGGAFTDSVGMQLSSMSQKLQDHVMEGYFGDNGLEYNLCRVPMGASDFSPRPYTLADTPGDTTLSQFALQEEDLKYKIPFMKRAQELRGTKPLNFYGSYWTAPTWMKDNNVWNGFNKLKEENYQIFADYIKKFFDAYESQGIKFWGFTTGNEPDNGFTDGMPVPCMSWTASNQKKWLINNLGPTLKNSQHKDIKIILFDENLGTIQFVVPPFLSDPKSLQYVDGVATHWYSDGLYNMEMKLMPDTVKKEIFTMSSEACFFVTQPLLGDWTTRATQYLSYLFRDLEYGYSAWSDWNLIVNATGGYTWINLPADAAIVLSANRQEFYKQPWFYIMGHFSKFVIPDSYRVNHKAENTANDVIKTLSFTRPDNVRVVMFWNTWGSEGWGQVIDGNKKTNNIHLSPYSLTTVVYKP